jgi:hypothetical protein
MDETRLSISKFEIKNARALFVRILLFAPLLLLVSAVNLCLDPEAVYRKTSDKHQMNEYRIAQALAEGSTVTVIRPINDRLLQKYFIENLSMAPDIVVLGSSNSVWLGDNVFPGKKIINNSVSYAQLADYLGIFEGYAKRGLYPGRVILFLNPQLILSPVTLENWVSIKEDTYGMLERLGIRRGKIKHPIMPRSWQHIFSFSYFQESMQELSYRHRRQAYFVNQDIPGGQVFYKDGRQFRDRVILNETESDRRKAVRKFYQVLYQQAVRDHTKPDRDLEDILEKFIRYLMGHHIQVTLYLLPMHPQQYQSFLEWQKNLGSVDILGVEDYYQRLAQRLNLEIIGSFDPAVCHVEDRDFLDGLHIRNDVMEGIFKQKGSGCSMSGIS